MAESSKLSDKDAKGLQKGRTRRFSATVLIVILLFSFIYSTVVFIVVRRNRPLSKSFSLIKQDARLAVHWPNLS